MTGHWFRAAFVSVMVTYAASVASAAATGVEPLREASFDLQESAEVISTIVASCGGCDWGRTGHEAAVLRIDVDGRYSQHLILTRGTTTAEYKVMLGPLGPGRHTLTVSHDTEAWSEARRTAAISRIDTVPVITGSAERTAIALAPILYARPNTVGRFTDVPLVMWYETEETERGSRIRYSVIFSNEDGGTPADRLLATWGRLTDLEYVYGIEMDREGKVLEETFQGKDHEIVPFRGRREGRHPLLYVVTDNNMVKDEGATRQRFAPAPLAFDLTDASREKVMDENPWTYAITAREARREGRVVKEPVPGSKRIVDPRHYAVVELCTLADDTTFATFTFSLGVSSGQETRYYDSSSGVREFRISRSPDNFPNSCFRGAVALPEGTKPEEVSALRVRAHRRPPRKNEPPSEGRTGPAHLRRVNRLFLMSADDRPEPDLFSWTGNATLPLDGEAVTLHIKQASAAHKK